MKKPRAIQLPEEMPSYRLARARGFNDGLKLGENRNPYQSEILRLGYNMGYDEGVSEYIRREEEMASRASDCTIRKGDRVFIKPEWQDAGDEEYIWIALEDEDGGRVRISPINGVWLAGAPTNQIVETSMLEVKP